MAEQGVFGEIVQQSRYTITSATDWEPAAYFPVGTKKIMFQNFSAVDMNYSFQKGGQNFLTLKANTSYAVDLLNVLSPLTLFVEGSAITQNTVVQVEWWS